MWRLVNFHDNSQEIVNDEKRLEEIESEHTWSSIGKGYESREALFIGDKILEKPCVVCGNWASTHYHGNERMIEKNMCFSCNLWDLRSEQIEKPGILIVDGTLYSVGTESRQPNEFRGFGGRLFTYKYLSVGVIRTTTNLWCGGNIPKIWLPKFPDNAVFI